MYLPSGELPRVFLSDEEVEELKKVVLCGPQHLPNMMKEVLLVEKYHLDNLPHGKIPFCSLVSTPDLSGACTRGGRVWGK